MRPQLWSREHRHGNWETLGWEDQWGCESSRRTRANTCGWFGTTIRRSTSRFAAKSLLVWFLLSGRSIQKYLRKSGDSTESLAKRSASIGPRESLPSKLSVNSGAICDRPRLECLDQFVPHNRRAP